MDDETLSARDSGNQTAAIAAMSFLILFFILTFLHVVSDAPRMANSVASVDAGYGSTR
jgi:hypothetical protein